MIDNSLLETIARSASASVFLEVPRDRPVIPPVVPRPKRRLPTGRLVGRAVTALGALLRATGRSLTAAGDRLIGSQPDVAPLPHGCVPS
jgi:hypothetical protein